MARSKKPSPAVMPSTVVEAVRVNDDGKAVPINPGRVAADLALGRVRVVKKIATLYIEGEYAARLSYAAK